MLIIGSIVVIGGLLCIFGFAILRCCCGGSEASGGKCVRLVMDSTGSCVSVVDCDGGLLYVCHLRCGHLCPKVLSLLSVAWLCLSSVACGYIVVVFVVLTEKASWWVRDLWAVSWL
jgi:hypothetical protein